MVEKGVIQMKKITNDLFGLNILFAVYVIVEHLLFFKNSFDLSESNF